MKATIVWPWKLPEKLPNNSLIVVADVYAATSNISLFLAKGVKRLIIVNEKNVVLAKKQYGDALVIGESRVLPPDFFIAPNIPSTHTNLNFKDKTILYMSNNGSKAIELIIRKGAETVLAASYLNMQGITQYLMDNETKQIFFVPAGDFDLPGKNALEDMVYFKGLNSIFEKKDINLTQLINESIKYISSYYQGPFFNSDMDLIFDVNKYPAVPICQLDEDGLIQVKCNT